MEYYAIVEKEITEKSNENIDKSYGTAVPVGFSVTFFKIFPENTEHSLSSVSYRAVTLKNHKLILANCRDNPRPEKSLDIPPNSEFVLCMDIPNQKYGYPEFRDSKILPLSNSLAVKSKCPFLMEFMFNRHTIVIQDSKTKLTAVCKKSKKELFVVTRTLFVDVMTSTYISNLSINKEEIERIKLNPGNETDTSVFVLNVDIEEFLLLIIAARFIYSEISEVRKGFYYGIAIFGLFIGTIFLLVNTFGRNK